jgi:hypothetical protein
MMTPPTPEAPHMPSRQTIPGCWPRLHNSRLMLAGRLAGAVPSGGDRQSGQSGNRLRAGLMHDRSTVILDGALADAELPGDNFIGSAGQDQFQDLLLSGGQRRDTGRSGFSCGIQCMHDRPRFSLQPADDAASELSRVPPAIQLPALPVRGRCSLPPASASVQTLRHSLPLPASSGQSRPVALLARPKSIRDADYIATQTPARNIATITPTSPP